jgi:hypothetical protein
MPFRLSLPTLLLAAIAAASTPAAAQTASSYGDVYDYFTTDAQYEAWYTLTTQLRRNFDDICGDTFCEGDYANIQSLGYRCSVERASGRIGRCLWLFAGSYEDIDPATGRFAVHKEFWRCRTPLAPDTTIDALLAATAGDEPLYAPLPGTSTTIYDGLADCL